MLGHSFGIIPGPAVWLALPVASTATGVTFLVVGTSHRMVTLPVTNGQGLQESHRSPGVLGGLHSLLWEGIPAMLPQLGTWQLLLCPAQAPPGTAGSMSQPGQVPRQLPFPTQDMQVDAKGHMVVSK